MNDREGPWLPSPKGVTEPLSRRESDGHHKQVIPSAELPCGFSRSCPGSPDPAKPAVLGPTSLLRERAEGTQVGRKGSPGVRSRLGRGFPAPSRRAGRTADEGRTGAPWVRRAVCVLGVRRGHRTPERQGGSREWQQHVPLGAAPAAVASPAAGVTMG